MKPEMTFGRAVRALVRWWWVLVAAAIASAAVAASVTPDDPDTYTAGQRVHVVETTVSYAVNGVPLPFSPPNRQADDLSADVFVVRDAARLAARDLSDMSGDELFNALSFGGVSPTSGRLTIAAPTEATALRRLRAYVDAYIGWKRDVQRRPLERAADRLEGNGGDPEAVQELRTAIETLPQQIYPIGEATVSVQRGRADWLAPVGGALAGLAVAALLILLLTRFDRRVRRVGDVSLPGVPVVALDSGRHPETIERLRLDLELAGLGEARHVLAALPVAKRPRRTPVALELARSFARSGRRTVLVGGDLRAGRDGPAEGVAGFLAGRQGALRALAVEDNLVWVPAGTAAEQPEALVSAARLDALVAEARRLGDVVIVDGPRASFDAESGLLAAASDITLLVVHRGRTSWKALEGAVETLARAQDGPVVACYDSSLRSAATVPAADAAAPLADDAAERPERPAAAFQP